MVSEIKADQLAVIGEATLSRGVLAGLEKNGTGNFFPEGIVEAGQKARSLVRAIGRERTKGRKVGSCIV